MTKTPVSFTDLFRYYRGLPHQMAALKMLGELIPASLLHRENEWFKVWSQAGKIHEPTTPMVGPIKRPQDCGFKEGDTHLLVNDISQRAKAFDFSGKLLWEVPCLARGQGSDKEWRRTGEDTPPGLYKIGQVYNDWGAYGINAPRNRTTLAYGWLSFDLIELEGQEARYGRAGIMIHGGGTGCGWPGAWASHQPLLPTFGCVRMHNIDLRDKLLPLTKVGTVFVSVYQEG